MITKRLLYFLEFFALCGFNAGISDFTKSSKYRYFILINLVTMALILTWFHFYLMIEFYPLLGVVESISESLQYLASLITYWLIIFDSILNAKYDRNLWKILQKIDKRFSILMTFSYHRYMIKFIEFHSVTILLFVARPMIHVYADIIIEIAYNILFKMCHIRIFYYIFCIEIVHFQLTVIKNDLENMKLISRRRYSVRHFKWIRDYYSCVHELTNHLNRIFGWSHVAVILFCFYLFVTDLNWFYIHCNQLTLSYRLGNSF